eukprot:GHVP01045090.1.p1 GENE.GHVP01045090.1~~GHVP01045090.1.p1  ORF type:complete len:235 (+),score=38.55 GHVP01045090.1:36-707(+)
MKISTTERKILLVSGANICFQGVISCHNEISHIPNLPQDVVETDFVHSRAVENPETFEEEFLKKNISIFAISYEKGSYEYCFRHNNSERKFKSKDLSNIFNGVEGLDNLAGIVDAKNLVEFLQIKDAQISMLDDYPFEISKDKWFLKIKKDNGKQFLMYVTIKSLKEDDCTFYWGLRIPNTRSFIEAYGLDRENFSDISKEYLPKYPILHLQANPLKLKEFGI